MIYDATIPRSVTVYFEAINTYPYYVISTTQNQPNPYPHKNDEYILANKTSIKNRDRIGCEDCARSARFEGSLKVYSSIVA